MWRSVVILATLLLGGCLPPQAEKGAQQQALQLQQQLGLSYLQQQRLSLAREHLQRAAHLATISHPAWGEIQYGLGLVAMRSGAEVVAENHFQQALAANPPYLEAANGYGVLLCRQGKVKEADHYFLRVINNPEYNTPEVAVANRKRCGEERR